jgi:hypothetical protein
MTSPRPGETAQQRADRNFADLLQETRVLQTGVQVLFAFLLTIPFQSAFGGLDVWQRTAYVVSLSAAAAATVLLVATVAAHRAFFGRGIKQSLVGYADRIIRAGVGFLGLAVAAGLDLVLDVVIGRTAGLVAATITSVAVVLLWYILPRLLVRRGLR